MPELDITIDQRSKVPLYEQICQQIRHKIESRQLQQGMILPTNQSLRTQLQISYQTAHLAMATLAKEGYITRRARRGTVVKGIPRRGVVAIYSYTDLLDPGGKSEYYRLITGHLSRQLEGHARVHRLYLGSSTQNSTNSAYEDLLRHLSGGMLCGVLLVNTPPRLEQLVLLGRSSHVPVVSLSGHGHVDYSVRIDGEGFLRAAVASLGQRGRRRVGIIYNRLSHSSLRNPEQFADILEQCGYSSKPSWIAGGEDSEQGGYEAAAAMPMAELDGLILMDDVMAVGVDRRLREMNIDVPGKLTVAMWWNHGSHLRLTLPFERYEVDVARQADLSLQLVQDVISGHRISEPHLKITPNQIGERHLSFGPHTFGGTG
ncbi:MAG: GntR family transcriptional regulator [Phycisphaerales bacterium]|nr:GntR family transcriptional regulator [Phycisphaerales bacterium]